MKPGILALQGCIDPHLRMFAKLGIEPRLVLKPTDLENINRLLLPGGESTTMLKLMERNGLYPALAEFGKSYPVWGICAGAILIAKEVRNPGQRSLGLLDIRATRNFYGSQLDSFQETISIQIPQPSDSSAKNESTALKIETAVDFIRAPLLEPLSDKVSVLAKRGDQPVLLQQGNVVASAFHTELGDDCRLHQYFLALGSRISSEAGSV